MHHRTRTLLLRTTLTLLALGFATGLGISKAAASPEHAAATIHKISACGYVAAAPGTYSLTKSVTDSGNGPCITLQANNVTLNLNSHTITGTGTDTCVDVEGDNSVRYANEDIVGGPKAKPATLTNCQRGVNVNLTSGTKISDLTIVAPTGFGVFANAARAMVISTINVPLHASDAVGFYLEQGTNNVVTNSTVGNNGTGDSFYAYAEVADEFTYDTAKTTNSHADADGAGFHEVQCSQDTYSRDTSTDQFYGFYLDEGGDGPVTATYDTATGAPDIYGSYGFYVSEAYNEAASPHTVISHNKTTRFQAGFYDTTADTSSAAAETWVDNTADNYLTWGFYIAYPTRYTLTGNIADANISGRKYAGGTTYGFYFDDASATHPFAKFAKNQAYDSEYGYYANGTTVHGQSNIAKRNKHRYHDVVNTG